MLNLYFLLTQADTKKVVATQDASEKYVFIIARLCLLASSTRRDALKLGQNAHRNNVPEKYNQSRFVRCSDVEIMQ